MHGFLLSLELRTGFIRANGLPSHRYRFSYLFMYINSRKFNNVFTTDGWPNLEQLDRVQKPAASNVSQLFALVV